MSKNVEVATPHTPLREAVQKMMNRRIRRLVVMDNGIIQGIVCHRDIARSLPSNINPFSDSIVAQAQLVGTVESVMKKPAITIPHSKPIEEAADIMMRHHIGGLPVTRQGHLAGIITESDIFRAFTQLLSGGEKSIRITVDLTEKEDFIPFLVESTKKWGLELCSIISFHENERRMGVACVRGEETPSFVDELWASGHAVVSILYPEPE